MGPELSKTWYLGQNLKKFGFCWCNFEHLYFILFLNSYKASKLHDMFVVFSCVTWWLALIWVSAHLSMSRHSG